MPALLTKSEMQAADRAAIETLGIPGLVLMEAAGRAVADRAEALYRRAPRSGVLAIAGMGNNGGDAIVAARHLYNRGVPVKIALAGEMSRASADCKKQLEVARALGIEVELTGEATNPARLFPAGWVAIDGLFGTGLQRAIEGWPAQLIEALNRAALEVVAVDIPSGIDADDGQILGAAVRATETVTFQFRKLGHVLFPGREHTGVLHVADIGIPPACARWNAELVGDDVIEKALPRRALDTHKGTYGHLLVVAGVADRPGSALLVGRAAARTGAGLVTIGSDAETIRRIAPVLDHLMGLTLGERAPESERILRALESRSALAVGPSLEPNEALRALLFEVLMNTRVPAVLDAGALAALSTDVFRLGPRGAPTVLTPHPGEMAKLMGVSTREVQSARAKHARELAESANAVVVLKGASTVIARPDGYAGVVTAGNPGMATGGTGDVLTGVIGGLLAQSVEPFTAACAGVLLHGKAGDRAARRGEARLVASDLLDHLALREDGAA